MRSVNLIQMWLTQFDRGGLSCEDAEASVIAGYEAKIGALKRKVGRLTMELVKKILGFARERQREQQDSDPARCRLGCRLHVYPHRDRFLLLGGHPRRVQPKGRGLHTISRRIDTPLALAALQSAVQSRKPPPGCIYHTDRGNQYAGETYAVP